MHRADRDSACLGIKRDGLDFAAIDNQPSRIFVVLLGSPWVQLAGKIGVESMILAILTPGLNLIILILICRLMGRRV